ncbi:HAD hydrolase-like protein [Streptomyces sp. AK010]|uniref:HAD hydrolase-like protein n=1 Tax=Streptomyces sp. AK010 TaxID=2723074 RepID=UPI00160B4D0B
MSRPPCDPPPRLVEGERDGAFEQEVRHPPIVGNRRGVIGRICTGPAELVVVGSTAAGAEAARRAGAHDILVPNGHTRPAETVRADHVAPDLLTAVRAVLDGPPKGRVLADERPIREAFTADPE